MPKWMWFLVLLVIKGLKSVGFLFLRCNICCFWVLVGTGRACFETLRPIAYSLLAEIIHHVQQDLSLSQLSRIIYLFSSNMHDASLSLSVHTMCARLMLNLVKPVFEKGVNQEEMDEARVLLLLEEGEEESDRLTLRSKLELSVQAVLNLQVPREHSKEVRDCKNLIKTLFMGMKTIIWSITNAHLPQAQVSPSSNVPLSQVFKGMREEEVCKVLSILTNGIYCLALFKEKDRERDILHLFSQILAIMEPRNLMDMFSMCMPDLFQRMINVSQLLHIFHTLLQELKVFCPFIDVLVNFLVNSKLGVLKHPDTPVVKLVLQLFRDYFGAVSKAPSDCERILQPHVVVIMEVSIKNATEFDRPLGYLQLLRTMFLALNGSKFELILHDLVPMVEGPTGEDTRELVLELCLTLPAHLRSLLPIFFVL